MTNASSPQGPSRLVILGKIRMFVLGAMLAGIAIIAAFAAGRRAGPSDASASAKAVGPSAMAATVANNVTVLTAPTTDSLDATILDSSTVVLAPGASLSIGQGIVNPMGARAWDAALSGGGRFMIRGDKRILVVHAAAGRANLMRGTFEIAASPAALVVHTIAGDTPLLYKPHGLFSWIPRKVPPDDVGVADQAHWAMRVTKQR